jgi:hypothetical protein
MFGFTEHGGVEVMAFFEKPFHSTATLGKDFVEKRHAGQDARAFNVECCGSRFVADYKTAVVKARRVFAEPFRDLRFEVDGKKVGRVTV